MDDAIARRLVAAAEPLPPGLGELIAGPRVGDPQVGDVWRVGRTSAQLAWVRRVFNDGVADVIPLTLHIEHANRHWLMLPASATPLGMELGAITVLRTLVVFEAFLNRICVLDIGPEIAEVMAADREGRLPCGVDIGPVCADPRAAFGFRQELRAFYHPLTPCSWT